MRRSTKIAAAALVSLFLGAAARLALLSGEPSASRQAVVSQQQRGVHSLGSSPFGLANQNTYEARVPGLFKSTDVLSKSEQIERLSATGNPSDAFTAYKLVANCQWARVFSRASLPVGAVEEQTARDANVKETCGNITELQIRESSKNLDIAIAAKVPGSAVEFSMMGPISGDWTALESRPDDPLVLEWKRKDVQFLTEAAGRGDTDSMWVLSTTYDAGIIADKNPELAVTYFTEMQEVLKQRGELTPKKTATGEKLVKLFSQGLSAEQASAAIAAGKQLAVACCGKGSLP